MFAAGATTVTELPFSGGSYGQPISLGTYTGTFPYGVGVDAGDDVFVAEEGVNSIAEIPFSERSLARMDTAIARTAPSS